VSKRTIVLAVGAILALLVGMQVAFASHPELSLTGSNFEIDTDANLVTQDAAPSIDWDAVNEVRKADTASGQDDESFGEGTKENTANPTIVDGGIPPNKSDLKFFGVYQEGGTSSGFLNLFWSRVQDPTGTTNMDFELNRNKCEHVDDDNDSATPAYNDDNDPDTIDTPTTDSNCAGNGVTPRRSTGDILIQYDLANGGTVATISFRRWTNNNQWSGLQSLAGNAVGTINSSPIDADDADGLGAHDPRTFGEAQVRLSALIGGSNTCVAFGSAYLKSRSSDQFNSALKDFVPPESVNITTCGSVNITKTDDATPANALNGAVFTLFNDNAPTAADGQASHGAEDTATNLTCTTAGTGTNAGKCSISNVPFGNYWVVETTTPTGHDTAPDQVAVVSAASPTVSLTFVNPRQLGAIEVTKTAKHKGSDTSTRNLAATFTVKQNGNTVGTITTDGTSGEGCLGNLTQGSYTVEETSGPSGYAKDTDTETVAVNNKASCDLRSGTATTAGEQVGFENVPLTNITVSAQSQVGSGTASTADDATASKITCTNQAPTPPDSTPNDFDDTSETVVNLAPGTYTCTVVVDP
jgi:hypothetical protein